jgi:hypothetical protein
MDPNAHVEPMDVDGPVDVGSLHINKASLEKTLKCLGSDARAIDETIRQFKTSLKRGGSDDDLSTPGALRLLAKQATRLKEMCDALTDATRDLVRVVGGEASKDVFSRYLESSKMYYDAHARYNGSVREYQDSWNGIIAASQSPPPQYRETAVSTLSPHLSEDRVRDLVKTMF